MICPNCETPQLPGAKFCKRCGSRLAEGCPTCGAPLEADALFCSECGTPIAGPAAAQLGSLAPGGGPVETSDAPFTTKRPVMAAPVAELRLVSVLFADLVSFTSLSEDRDAEDTRDLLSRYFELARQVVGLYGGTVEKFIGDAVMAVWGTPTAHEDDAERAVRAGLELVTAVRRLGPAIQARAAVLTGEAAVTLGATNQGMVAGDLVNTASRLQSVAAPGAVLVGEATVRAASAAIAFEPAGEQTLRGKSAPVPAWQATRVIAMRGGGKSGGQDALEPPFVGRDEELRLLKELFHSTSREGRARLVSVTGHAGLGKSRLAWEFLKYIDGLVETVWWHAGRSPAYGEGVTFWALGEMIRRRCGLMEGDDERTTRAKVAATLAEHVPDEAERRWIEPALLQLLGFETGVDSDLLFGAWRTFFERLASSAPVILVFEDFHYADSGLLDFVDHLMEWSRNFPLLVLTLARPELLEKRPHWGAAKRNFTSLYLEPLAQADMRALLAGLAPRLPSTTVRAIVDRADGVPLYAVETIRMLVAEGKLAFENGVYRPVGDLTMLAVPQTLTALIASRLDALDPVDRGVVQDAAVLGQSFTLEGVAAVSGLTRAELEPRLRTLVRRELLTLETDPRSPERGQYAFVQALIREVAYNTLPKKDRKSRHLAAARFFESLGTELAGALADHYLAAYRSAQEGPEAEALAAQARIALRSAGERAAALGSHPQAVSFFEEALTVAKDPAEAATLHEKAAESAAATECGDEAEAHLQAALKLRAELPDRSAEAATTAAYGRIMLRLFRHQPALALLSEASKRFASLGDDPNLVRLNGQLARAYFLTDQLKKAIEVGDGVLESAERLSIADVVADTLVTRGSALVDLGRRYEGVGAIETGQRIAASLNITETVVRALNNLAAVQNGGDPHAALAAAREGIALCNKLGMRETHLLDNAVFAAKRTGDWDWAVELVEPFLSQEDDPLGQTIALSGLVDLRVSRGEPVDDLMVALEGISGSDRDKVQPTMITRARAWIAWVAGDYQKSREGYENVAALYSQSLFESLLWRARAALAVRRVDQATEDLARFDELSLRGRSIETDRATVAAGIAALEGRTDEALSAYREALRSWREMQLVWDEAVCAIEMAELLDPAEPEVADAIESAREILTRLRARPFLERLERAVAAARSRQTSPARVGFATPDVSATRSRSEDASAHAM